MTDSDLERRLGSPRLSVIIVNYNAGTLIADCVEAVISSDVPVQILVSDNGSEDGSPEELERRFHQDPRFTLVKNRANLGFAAGSNRVLEQATAPFLLFLNPDCIVTPEALVRMLGFIESTPAAGMAGCIIRNPDGSEQVASRRVIPDPWIGLVRFLHLHRIWPRVARGRRLNLTDEPLPDTPVEVQAISGSFMLVRRAALDAVGPLDEGYFLHCEDLDWFVRFQQAGWGIYLVPDVSVLHYKGSCSQASPARVEWHKHRGMQRFFDKFQRRRYPIAFSMLVIAGIWAHFGVVALAGAMRRSIRGGS